MAHRIPITVHLDSFEGPLDLLLYLIQSHELDISKVSISKITDQYLAYVRLMQELCFDTASEFLVMASTLLLWKSKALLPKEENSEQQEAVSDEFGQIDLVRQLLEHQKYLKAGENLAQLPRLDEDVFTRPSEKSPIEKIWKEMDVTGIVVALQETLVRSRRRVQILKKETVSLSDKILEFGLKLSPGKLTDMRELITSLDSRPETVVTFLASLELARLKKMRLFQEKTYDPIYLELLESLVGFDTEMASGFEPEALIKKVQLELTQEGAQAELQREALHG